MANELTVNFRLGFSSSGLEMDYPPINSSSETKVDVVDTSPNDMTILIDTTAQWLPADIVAHEGLFALQNLDDTNYVQMVDSRENAPAPMILRAGDPPFFFRSENFKENEEVGGWQLQADTDPCYVRVIYIRESS